MTEIRRLTPADLPLCRALNAMLGAAFEEPEAWERAPPPDGHLASLLGQPHVVVLAAVEGAEPIGGLLAYELPKLEQARSEVYLYDLAVAAPHRRRGVATALIAELKRIAKARGAWVIFVQADRVDAPAVALYEKLGGPAEEPLHFDIPVDREGGPSDAGMVKAGGPAAC